MTQGIPVRIYAKTQDAPQGVNHPTNVPGSARGCCAPMRQLIDDLEIHKEGLFVITTIRLQLVSSLGCRSTCDLSR